MSFFLLHTDGAARGNPGPAGAGAVLYDATGEEIATVVQYLGETTNNQAEYQALLLGLDKAIELKIESIEIKMDSELIVRQIQGLYKVKHEGLRPLYLAVMEKLKQFKAFKISHVRRELNKRADELSNEAIDKAL